ncbi:MAG TPA: hypothetical protein VFQ68_29460 [Streptosporangiaceae bacterium]|nr:hypothetical protein [Streptosporangiaceae bacterium]
MTVPASGIAGPGGVFAGGTAGGHAWRLAVENIADPGYRCLPAITVNGPDANLVQPNPRNYAAVALGPAAPGLGFAYVQLPADVTGIVLVAGRLPSCSTRAETAIATSRWPQRALRR